MSSTTVPIRDQPVVVLESRDSPTNLRDLTADVCGLGSSHANTGSASSRISIKTDGNYNTWILPAVDGLNVVKLELIPYRDIQHVEKKNWWRYATHRTTFVTTSATSQINAGAERLMANMLTHIVKHPEVQKEDQNRKSSYSFFS